MILPSERCQGQILEYWAEDFYFQKNLPGGSSIGPWAYESGGTGGYCTTDADCVGRDDGRLFGFANLWTGAATYALSPKRFQRHLKNGLVEI